MLKELRKAMIDGFFRDGHIDEERNLLLFPSDGSAGTPKTIICKSGGGPVELISSFSEKCPYCGTVNQDSC